MSGSTALVFNLVCQILYILTSWTFLHVNDENQAESVVVTDICVLIVFQDLSGVTRSKKKKV